MPAARRKRHAAAAQGARRARAQPEGHRRRDPARHAHLSSPASAARASRRSSTTCSTPALKRAKGDWDRKRRRVPPARGRRARHRRRARRPGADRPDAALESGHLPEGVRSDPRAVRVDQGRASARPDRQPLLVQRARAAAARRARAKGQVRVEMQFLADVFVPCDAVRRQALQAAGARGPLQGQERSTQVLDLTVREALQFFAGSPKVLRRLQVLDEIGLGYLRLGQPATTLSGGEAQRDQDRRAPRRRTAASGCSTSSTSRRPACTSTTSPSCWPRSASCSQAGHTLLVIEHNLDVIKTADWVIDLGPEGGEAGGRVVAIGTPEQVAHRRGVAHRPLPAGGAAGRRTR